MDFKLNSTVGHAVTADVSETGIFLYTDEEATADSQVLLKLHLSASKTLRVMGKVVRQAIQAEAPGVGVRFTGIRSDDQEELRKFVTLRLPPGPSNSTPTPQEGHRQTVTSRSVARDFDQECLAAADATDTQTSAFFKNVSEGPLVSFEKARETGQRLFTLAIFTVPLTSRIRLAGLISR